MWTIALIFWLAFAVAASATSLFTPALFERQDPDSLMRLVQVRDLLGGQGWFDLVQHRLDPPNGVLMHWSRLIDAPIAGLVLLGDIIGDGERFALIAWPLLMLLGLMSANMSVATALAGRAAAVPVLILTLLFFSPLFAFLPGSIDHHNAQLALMMATIAALMRCRARQLLGLAAGFGCALMLAIGMEMLPYVALFGAVVALRWGFSGEGSRGTALFGATFAVSPTVLHLFAGSPAAALACDSLSWAYALPAAAAGGGLAALALSIDPAAGRRPRLAALGALGAAVFGTVLMVSPDCLSGPYGFLTPELKAIWLSTVTEAQPLLKFAAREPAGIVATFGPPALALAVALRRIRQNREAETLWLFPAATIALALAMSFYQVRTLPYANAAAIPVLAAWLAEIATRHGVVSLRPFRRAYPLVAAFLIAMPLVHLGLGWVAVRAVSVATGGRIAPNERPEAPEALTANLSAAERDCIDPASAALLASVPRGLVLAPVFYGSSILALSAHDVVAAPYHRGGAAILDAIRAMSLPPDRALPIVEARGVEYLALCATSRESAIAAAESSDSLHTRLLSGATLDWLEPIASAETTALRLYRVRL